MPDAWEDIPEPIDLDGLLDRIELFVRRFVIVNEAQATAITLWVAHTWAIDAAHATAYLYVTSAEPECGKTRLLEVVKELVRSPISTMNVSDAALFRAIEAKSPTLLFDEVDAIFGKKAREREDLRSLLNAGYRRGEVVLRMGGGNNTTLEMFHVFGAKALAGLGKLPPTLASRCLRIELKRRRPEIEPVEDFFPEELAAEAIELDDALRTWSEEAVPVLKAMRPDRVEGLRDRVNEVWRPLLAIAESAGETWTARARRAAVALASAEPEDEASLGVLLLEDIRTVFEKKKVQRIASTDLILALARGFDESPWGEWWVDERGDLPVRGAARQLAQKLRPYGIRTNHTVRDGKKTAKGYRREDFVDAWERFLPAGVDQSHQSHQSHLNPQAVRVVTDVTDVTDGREGER